MNGKTCEKSAKCIKVIPVCDMRVKKISSALHFVPFGLEPIRPKPRQRTGRWHDVMMINDSFLRICAFSLVATLTIRKCWGSKS